MLLLCENSLKAEQEEYIEQEKSIKQEESSLNQSNEKENELKSIPRIYYYSAGTIVIVIALIIYFIKNKSVNTSSSEEKNTVAAKISQRESNRNTCSTVEGAIIATENVDRSSQSAENKSLSSAVQNEISTVKNNAIQDNVKEKIKVIITFLLELDENSSNHNLELEAQIRKYMENIKKNIKKNIKDLVEITKNYQGNYENNIQYNVCYGDKFITVFFIHENKSILSLYCDTSDINVKLNVDKANWKIIFKDGQIITIDLKQSLSRNMSIKEMKERINTFFKK